MIQGYDYLQARSESVDFKMNPYKVEQKKWADWNKDVLKRYRGVWFRIYLDNGNWDWYFEATQDNFGTMWMKWDYEFRYPSDTGRDTKEIWARRIW